MGVCNCSMFCCMILYVHYSFAIILMGEERAGCFAYTFVFLVSRDCCVALPRGAMGLSAVCDCGFPDHTHQLFYIEQISINTQIDRNGF